MPNALKSAATAMEEVLYGDYNGHMRPLRLMYFSLDSRCLVANHPESVQEEVESHFCPHCNALCTTPEAQSNGNRCARCILADVLCRHAHTAVAC